MINNIIKYIAVVLLILITTILILNKCNKDTKTITNKTVINNYYDSSIKFLDKPTIIKGAIEYIDKPTIIDTQAILKDYYAKRPYKRIFEDSSLRVTIIDTTYKNQLLISKFSYQFLKPIKTIISTTTTVNNYPSNKIKLFIGAFGQINKNNINGYGPELSLLTKKENLYGINYNLKDNSIGIKLSFIIIGKK
jgi:hypothetical protein